MGFILTKVLRYETILWFTKSDDYYFDFDDIRVPQKYPKTWV